MKGDIARVKEQLSRIMRSVSIYCDDFGKKFAVKRFREIVVWKEGFMRREEEEHLTNKIYNDILYKSIE